MKPCKHTTDGYCIRPENGYCPADDCKGDHSITEICLHPHTAILVTNTAATCETTVEVCLDCDKHLTKPETDCR